MRKEYNTYGYQSLITDAQLAYHLLSVDAPTTRRLRKLKTIRDLANSFHRVASGECEEIPA